ncbi:MAG TPA: phospholipase D family protein [Steroidobacter sp.]
MEHYKVRARRFIAIAVAALLLGYFAACAQLDPRPQLPNEAALTIADDTPLDQATAPMEASYPDQSAFRLVVEGTEAVVVRVQSARMAKRSLDVQSYIWHADVTGMFFANELLLAADRGVKVRVLLDDVDARKNNDAIAALSAHPNIQVRTFNPFASRSGTFRLIAEGLRSFSRINRRMHNKTWIADNRLAVAGGRNIGDEYFGASDEVNFVDLDFAMIGPVVRQASASFDEYWNSASAYPMEVLDPKQVSSDALNRLRQVLTARAEEAQQSPYAKALQANDAIKRMVDGDWPMEWSPKYQFVADDPNKVTMKERDEKRAQVSAALVPVAEGAQSQLSIVSPYFVPGDRGTAILTGAARAERSVRILTNSLVANDVAAVHGGYSRYRKQLLDAGVQLWELKPLWTGKPESSFFGSSGASLHTKALAVDGRTLFVGSYNLDPRSAWLNCEQGVLVENETLAMQFEQIFKEQSDGEHAWRVSLEQGKLSWSDGNERLDEEPDASLSRRFQAWFARVFHLDAQL